MTNKDLTQQITLVLTKSKEARDCDVTLYIEILKNYGNLYGSVINLLWDIKANRCPSYDTITRLRRKIQTDMPELRGEIWNRRHQEKQDKAKTDLGYAIK